MRYRRVLLSSFLFAWISKKTVGTTISCTTMLKQNKKTYFRNLIIKKIIKKIFRMRSFEIGTYQFHRLFVDTNQNFRWDKPEHAPPADEKIFLFLLLKILCNCLGKDKTHMNLVTNYFQIITIFYNKITKKLF